MKKKTVKFTSLIPKIKDINIVDTNYNDVVSASNRRISETINKNKIMISASASTFIVK